VNNDSPAKAILVVLGTAFVCSLLVTIAAVRLKPIQRAYQDLERNRFIVGISGLASAGQKLEDSDVVDLFRELDPLLIDIDAGKIDGSMNPLTFDQRAAAGDPELGVAIPSELDSASLSRRSRYATVFVVGERSTPQRIVLPMHGQGMWSTLYGYLALEGDMNTIADVTFYEQGETAGIGDQILDSGWQARWRGRKLYGADGVLAFRIGDGVIDDASPAAEHQVDAIAGATVTTNAVTALVQYWFGPHGFGPYLQNMQAGEAGS
jgi:Na+-transporting NADH:ubiquinone oxidoreductase subunit C